MKRTLSLPLVALIAVAALVLGTFGTAHAAALTAKQVRKIAVKVITKKAPGLSVAHAAKADSATKADTATNASNASNAAHAADSDKLGGQLPQLYLDRIGFVTADHVGVGADTANLLGKVTITVPAGASIIHIIGTASLPAASTETSGLWTKIDEPNDDCNPMSGSDYTRRSQATGYATLTTQFATPVTAGTHTVILCATTTNTGIFADNATLSVETLPRGSSGGGSL